MKKKRTGLLALVILIACLTLPFSAAQAYTIHYTYRYTTSGWQLVSSPTTTQTTVRAVYAYYRVQPGDTLYRLATRFKTTTAAIKQLNRLSTDTIYVGQVILIPLKGTQLTPAPAPAPQPAPIPSPAVPTQPVSGLTQAEQQMLDLVNRERVNLGLRPLQADLQLTRLARLKSQDMINKNYFAHQSPTYGSPFDMMRADGVTYRYAGENLAGAPTVDRAHSGLMNSSGHRANILNVNYTHIGIGAVSGGPYGMMFTQMFIGK
jgi:uncharacterized YkwD family protein